ncbi:hypothetical protein QBC38DRAFT_451349 [Podospora fimiseda]|uniref:Uncharacterized protein n=1 Tax=Podospora fimiseda TaxID=252190 RepID=A0AAN7H7N5_9PEZI|nr:hypothetical protein QBC38DRAFT_451349 [Podospora fimiseda]
MHTPPFIFIFLLLSSVINALLIPTDHNHELNGQELPPAGQVLPAGLEKPNLDELMRSHPRNQENHEERQLVPEILPLIKPLIPSRPPGQKVLQRRRRVPPPSPPVFPPIGPLIPIDIDHLEQLIPNSSPDNQILPPILPHQLKPAHEVSPVDQQMVPPLITSRPTKSTKTPSLGDLNLPPYDLDSSVPYAVDRQILPAGAPDPLEQARARNRNHGVYGVTSKTLSYSNANTDVNIDKYSELPTICPWPYQEFCCTKLDYSGMQVKCVGPGPVSKLEDCLRFEPMPMCCCGLNPIPRGDGKPPHAATFSCDPKCKALTMKRRVKIHE